jgi:25S rRNA (adenine2142-N1)-methyltransferase
MGRKRKLHTGVTPLGGSKVIKSRRKARVLTSAYHKILNKIHSVENDETLSKSEKKGLLKELNKQKEESIDGYQQSSVISTAHFSTSKWVLKVINQRWGKVNPNTSPLRVLEVGAINNQLTSLPFLNVRAIDINSQHPSIEEKDFFDIDPGIGEYDLVVCSMVMNCVPDPFKRGEMLLRIRSHLKDLKSLAIIILPKRCMNEIYMGTEDNFINLLKACGFEIVPQDQDTPKLSFIVISKGKAAGVTYQDLVDKKPAFFTNIKALQKRMDVVPLGDIAKLRTLCFSNRSVPENEFNVQFSETLIYEPPVGENENNSDDSSDEDEGEVYEDDESNDENEKERA